MILTGIFATKTINTGGNDGLFYGNPSFFFTQLKGLSIVVVYSFSASYGIFKFINRVMPMRVSEEDEEIGLDASQHDEKYLQGTLLVKKQGAAFEDEISLETAVIGLDKPQTRILVSHQGDLNEEKME